MPSKKQSANVPTIQQYRDLRKDLINFNTSEDANAGGERNAFRVNP